MHISSIMCYGFLYLLLHAGQTIRYQFYILNVFVVQKLQEVLDINFW